jgi:hypothetical protein
LNGIGTPYPTGYPARPANCICVAKPPAQPAIAGELIDEHNRAG